MPATLSLAQPTRRHIGDLHRRHRGEHTDKCRTALPRMASRAPANRKLVTNTPTDVRLKALAAPVPTEPMKINAVVPTSSFPKAFPAHSYISLLNNPTKSAFIQIFRRKALTMH